ncbi:winged helix-turn-helix domain-containing protein [Streptomyces sp. NPDC059063]|uniref:winged helix-turn-helix domain-containing protein n=1 Tax=unclassified Streptomyces TaxID=2593676 RepID=UPI0036C0CA93
MVYRIHFTVDDLARTRVAPSPLPLMELSAAVRILQQDHHPVRFGAWRRRALAGLRPEARMVLDLIRPRRPAPTFLTRAEAGRPQELLERVRATPRTQIHEDLAHVATAQPLPAWARGLADDRDLLRQLYDGLEHLYAVLLSPHWPQLTSSATADRGIRARQALTGGMEELLASANPRRIRWNPPVLEVAMASGLDGDLFLEGRGLLLVPTFFGLAWPALDIDAAPQPVLTCPAQHGQPPGTQSLFAPQDRTRANPSALAALLGHTRAAVLDAIAEHPGCSTKELALFVGVAPPSASEHATTLRTAGLIHTVRHRNTALHTLTALGTGLLNAPGDPSHG